MTLEEFKQKFYELKEKGYVKSLRRGPTGIGYTLETYLGIKENNLILPDISGVEIKAHRSNSNSLITLFTFNREAWKIYPLDAIKKYGSLDKNGRIGLYHTVRLKPNSAGLFLSIEKQNILLKHISGEIIICWNLSSITQRFQKKIPALLFVSALTEEREGVEYFYFYRAQLMKETTVDLLADQFKAENLVIDLRLHKKGTKVRNHGTAFRVYEEKLPLLFKKIYDI